MSYNLLVFFFFFLMVIFIVFYFLLHRMQDLSSLTRETCAPCSGSMES